MLHIKGGGAGSGGEQNGMLKEKTAQRGVIFQVMSIGCGGSLGGGGVAGGEPDGRSRHGKIHFRNWGHSRGGGGEAEPPAILPGVIRGEWLPQTGGHSRSNHGQTEGGRWRERIAEDQKKTTQWALNVRKKKKKK